LAVYGSWRTFCRDDLTRRPARTRTYDRLVRHIPASWRTVLRLVVRQNRWLIVAVFAAALVLSQIINIEPIVFWSVGTLILGLVCGLAVFLPDQNGGREYLADQRIPLGRYWTLKTLCWFSILAIAVVFAWYVATGLSALIEKATLGSYQ